MKIITGKFDLLEYNVFFIGLISIITILFNDFHYVYAALIFVILFSAIYEHSILQIELISSFIIGLFFSEVFLSSRFLNLPLNNINNKITFIIFYFLTLFIIVNIIYFFIFQLIKIKNIIK